MFDVLDLKYLIDDCLLGQSWVSVRRIEKYLTSAEVAAVPPLESQDLTIAFNNATVTWPQERGSGSGASSATSTPRPKFVLIDLTLKFPVGEMSLICGRVCSLHSQHHSILISRCGSVGFWKDTSSLVSVPSVFCRFYADHYLSAIGRGGYTKWSSVLPTVAARCDCITRRPNTCS